ncbi:MAG: UbiA family prenyltransferase [Kiritimatiellia bacterium]
MHLRAWMRLFRLPNLVTVPGDPLAGLLLATGGVWPGEPRAFAVVAAPLFLYCAGLALNDLRDVDEDRVERPARPLPAGEISASAAWTAAAVFAAAGVLLSALAGTRSLLVGGLLLLMIVFYNVSAKRVSVAGPFIMGLCRGLSVLLGAAPFLQRGVSDPLLLLGAFESILLFIAMTTHLARSETHGKSPMYAAWAPFAVIFLTAGFGACRARPWGGALAAFGAAAILAALFATRAAMGMTERRRVVPWHIGILISALIPLQSMWIAAAGRWDIALALFALLPLNHGLKRLASAS